jgi:hypothetical protein
LISQKTRGEFRLMLFPRLRNKWRIYVSSPFSRFPVVTRHTRTPNLTGFCERVVYSPVRACGANISANLQRLHRLLTFDWQADWFWFRFLETWSGRLISVRRNAELICRENSEFIGRAHNVHKYRSIEPLSSQNTPSTNVDILWTQNEGMHSRW